MTRHTDTILILAGLAIICGMVLLRHGCTERADGGIVQQYPPAWAMSVSAAGVSITPKMHYKMNDNAANTTVTDSMGLHDGTNTVNTSTLSLAGKINTALSNSAAAYTRMEAHTDFLPTASFSFSVWVYPTLVNGTLQGIFEILGHPSAYGYMVWMNAANKFAFFVDSDGGFSKFASSDAAATQDAWQHIAGVWDGTMIQMYVNAVTQKVTGAQATVGTGNTRFVQVGNYDTSYFFKGRLDDVRFYTNALTQAQITAIYNAGNGTEGE